MIFSKEILRKFYLLLNLNKLSIKKLSMYGTNESRIKYKTTEILISKHFDKISPLHPCRKTLELALKKLSNRPALIIETGSSAWGVDSSLLFDSYVNSFGGKFETVDLRIEPMLKLRTKLSTNSILNCDDSVSFLKKWSLKNPNKKIDLLYLDSWDVNWNNPNASGLHGLAEYLAAAGHLQAGSILLIDDTPLDDRFFLSNDIDRKNFSKYFENHNFYPGKGSLVKQLLLATQKGREVAHHYQLLWEF